NGAREKLVLSLINVQEERTLKNVSAYVRDDVALRVRYENPPAFLNLSVLVSAPNAKYDMALIALSRAIMFFQHRSVFTQDTVDPLSLTKGQPVNELDQLDAFKLIFTLWSPTLEELNDMWGMLGGKQFPFALYSVRMLELRFRTVQRESGLITEIERDFVHSTPGS
ncbi:MAG: DUF4255 domain-containing protein, partial [Comamonadaceae bacterium]